MTWITDDHGTRWVDTPPYIRRKPSRAKRFAEVKVGHWLTGGLWEKPWNMRDGRKHPPVFHLVTDAWFDPVAGQDDPESGNLFALARLIGINRETGEPELSRKHQHTRRGLASQGYRYSDVPDPVAMFSAIFDGIQSGTVTAIGSHKKVRRYPTVGRPL